MSEQLDQVAALQAEAEEWVAVPSEVDSRSYAGESDGAAGVPIDQCGEAEPDVAETSSSKSESAPASVPFSDSGSEAEDVPSVPTEAPDPAPQIAAAEVREEIPAYDELPEPEWSQTECHMNDIRYAEKASATIPHRVIKKQLKVLVTGQPETGRTTTIKNLFASIAQKPDWSPPDVSERDLDDFQKSPELFTTSITDCPDTNGNLSISYIIQETPGLKGNPARCADVLCAYLQAQHDTYAAQERNLDVPREALQDGRVDAVLYFLPTNARMAESSLDTTVINAVARYAPVIPVMCKADCLEEEEVQRRKAEMERLMAAGLRVFTFPETIVNAITDAMHGLSHSPAAVSPTAGATALPPPPQTAAGPAFRLPFNVVAGNHADVSVHNFWFVRVYRWAMCEAYRTCNSDLRLLRQLLLEDGFWAIKEAADKLYRSGQAAVAAAPATASTGAQTSQVPKDPKDPFLLPEEIRHAGRGTHYVPALPSGDAATSKAPATGMPALFPYVPCPVASMRAATASRGFGSPLRSGCATAGWSSTLSVSPPSLDHVNPLLMASDATDGGSGPISAGTSALAALEAANPVPPAPVPAAPAAPAAAAVREAPAPAAAAAPVPETAPQDPQDAYDARMYVDATVKDVSRSLDRKNYRLTLRLEGGEKVLSMRIGDTEGASLSSLLKQSNTSRPTAYDATANLLKALGCQVERALVTDCQHTVFYALIVAVNRTTGVRVNIDARPSDAINLALRHNGTVHVHERVIARFVK